MWALQKSFQITSEAETLIRKKNSAEILFDGKMANKYGKIFLLTTNFYKSANYITVLDPENRGPEGKAYVHTEGMDVKKQENKITKQLATQKIHANKLHAKLVHPR